MLFGVPPSKAMDARDKAAGAFQAVGQLGEIGRICRKGERFKVEEFFLQVLPLKALKIT